MLDCIAEVSPVEAGSEYLGLLERQLGDNVLAHLFGSRGGQRDRRYSREIRPQRFQVEIVWSKVVSPFRYAVGLVDSEEANVQSSQEIPETR